MEVTVHEDTRRPVQAATIYPMKHMRQRCFLAAFRNLGNVSRAAQCAGIVRATHYVWMTEDAAYRVAFEDAREEAGDMIEAECWRRAVTGTLVPVFYNGKKVGTYRRYSDRLLIMLAKANWPEKYGSDAQVRQVEAEDTTLYIVRHNGDAECQGEKAA